MSSQKHNFYYVLYKIFNTLKIILQYIKAPGHTVFKVLKKQQHINEKIVKSNILKSFNIFVANKNKRAELCGKQKQKQYL